MAFPDSEDVNDTLRALRDKTSSKKTLEDAPKRSPLVGGARVRVKQETLRRLDNRQRGRRCQGVPEARLDQQGLRASCQEGCQETDEAARS